MNTTTAAELVFDGSTQEANVVRNYFLGVFADKANRGQNWGWFSVQLKPRWEGSSRKRRVVVDGFTGCVVSNGAPASWQIDGGYYTRRASIEYWQKYVSQIQETLLNATGYEIKDLKTVEDIQDAMKAVAPMDSYWYMALTKLMEMQMKIDAIEKRTT